MELQLKPLKRQIRTKLQWTILIKKWRQSGLSKAAFCRHHKICLSLFYKHCQKLWRPDYKEDSHAQKSHPLSTNELNQKLDSELGPDSDSSSILKFNNIKMDFIPVSLQGNSFTSAISDCDSSSINNSKSSAQLDVTLASGHRFCVQGIGSWQQVADLVQKVLMS